MFTSKLSSTLDKNNLPVYNHFCALLPFGIDTADQASDLDLFRLKTQMVFGKSKSLVSSPISDKNFDDFKSSKWKSVLLVNLDCAYTALEYHNLDTKQNLNICKSEMKKLYNEALKDKEIKGYIKIGFSHNKTHHLRGLILIANSVKYFIRWSHW